MCAGKMARRALPHVHPAEVGAVTRRSLLSWLGKSTVLALSPELVLACRDEPMVTRTGGAGMAAQGAAGTRAGPTGAPAGAGAGAGGADGGLSFRPGPEPEALLGNWRERTVDPQDLEALLAGWTLRIDGMVATPTTLSFADVLELPRQDQITDFHCVEGWSVYDVPWNGVHLREIVRLVEPAAAATHLTFHCVGGGYVESLPLSVALEPRTLLAYGIDGSTLPVAHGFPLRTVVPRLLGYKNAKYVQRIEFTDQAEEGYWVARGYSYDGEVPASRLRADRY